VTSIKCKDPATQAVLNEIIQEATLRSQLLIIQEEKNTPALWWQDLLQDAVPKG